MQLLAMHEPIVLNSILFSNNEYIRNSDAVPSLPFFRGINFKGKMRILKFINKHKSLSVYKKNDFDIFHPTYYDSYYLKVKSNKPTVITFHDLIHEKYLRHYKQVVKDKMTALKYVNKIIAISQNTKNDLMEYYGLPSDRIVVIPMASTFANQLGQTRKECECSVQSYFLYVGARKEGYKNFRFFVRAIAPLLINQSTYFLYCAGGGQFTMEEYLFFKELKIENNIKGFSGSDESLVKLYSTAIAFFCPSLYEGFGIPVLEAMNCGCPVACSQTSSLPEVAGDAALYFNPLDGDSILSSAILLITNANVRSNLIQKGFLRAKEFSWEKTANLTLQVYNDLV